MLDAGGQQAVGPQHEAAALAVQGLHLDAVGAGDVGEHAGNRQAAFLVGPQLHRALADDRVDQHQRLLALLGDVHYRQPVHQVHLRRSQADAGGLVHGLEHVIEQALERGLGDPRGIHGVGDHAQARIRVFNDWKKGHVGGERGAWITTVEFSGHCNARHTCAAPGLMGIVPWLQGEISKGSN